MSALRDIYYAFEAAADALSAQAWACFTRAVNDTSLRRIRFGPLGLPCPDDPDPLDSHVMGWRGAAAFPGVARVELPARGGLAQELPIGDLKVGALVLALPVLETTWETDDGGWLRCAAIDIVWCDPREPANWARASGLADRLGPDPAQRLDPEQPVRLHRDPLTWFRALAADPGTAAICMLDPLGLAGERLLLGPPLICDDSGHAAQIETLQRRARMRALKALPKPGRLFVARDKAVKAA